MSSFCLYPQISFSVKDTLCRLAKLAAAVGSSCLVIFVQVANADWFGDSREMMGATAIVRIWDDDAQNAERSVEAVFAEIDRIDKLMNANLEDSGVAAINGGAEGAPVIVDNEIFDLIVRALDISRLTRGAFDITFGSSALDSEPAAQLPAGTQIRKHEYGNAGYQFIKTNTRQHSIQFLKPGIRISLGGIVRGYVVERGAEILIERGVEHAIVTVGGDTKLLGDHLGEPWKIGIRDPRANDEEVASLLINDQAVSTSGDHMSFFNEDGERVHNIIEPATGLPATSVRTATVIGPDAVITDALSTSVFVMGVTDGISLLKTLPDYEGIVIDAKGDLYYSEGMDQVIVPEADTEKDLAEPLEEEPEE
jgi:thiamine biosynthesis lipoprotein